jgi:hypothetical protein
MSFEVLQSVAITVIVIGLLVWRQIRPRRLSERGLWLIPAILLYFILQSIPAFHPTPVRVIQIIITAVVSIVFGLLACRQLKVYASDKTGKAMAVGSWTYFLWWLGAFIVKAAIAVVFGETDFSKVSQVDILVPVLLLVVTRNVYLWWRVNELGLELHSHRER